MFIVVIALCGGLALNACVYRNVRRRAARATPAFAYAPPPSAVRVLRTRDEMHDVANRAYAREVRVAQAAQRRATHFAALTNGVPTAAAQLSTAAPRPALLSPLTPPGTVLFDD
jgi:hypothetical protein